MHRSLKLAAGFLALGFTLSQPACAQNTPYPSKPIKIILAFPPGGSADLIARLVAPAMSERFGQPVIVENRPGAGGAIAIGAVAKAPPDGYTIGVGAAGALAISGIANKRTLYDPLKDLAPIGIMIQAPFVLVANNAFKPKTIADVIAEGKSKPGTLSVGHGGPGTMMHLSTELFKHMSHVDAVVLPYKGTAPATMDAMAGQISLAMSDIPTALPYIKGGRLKAIAVTSGKRSSSLPDVPTFDESGLPKYSATGWIAMVAPAGTPPAIVQRLNTELVAALNQPAIREKIIASGSDPAPGTPAELSQLMRTEITKWETLINEAKIKIE
ncbi:Bug family tripartite tricarboxylate transporter substrate binding protein [Noviherbaspirillum saxi]|nr:tripartite tricarboxylate transporter substrate binding protein [Noviherbaspirillum saxi]